MARQVYSIYSFQMAGHRHHTLLVLSENIHRPGMVYWYVRFAYMRDQSANKNGQLPTR